MTADPVNPEPSERAAVAAPAEGFVTSLREWIPIPSTGADHLAAVAVLDALEAAFEQPVRPSRTGGPGPAAVPRAVLGVPVVHLGATLPDDRTHAPNERVVLPLPLRGAEAAARSWRSLPERLS